MMYRYWRNYVIDPSTRTYYRWLAVISASVLYNLVMIIARAIFWLLQQQVRPLWLTLDYICDVIYAMDMFVQFRTGI